MSLKSSLSTFQFLIVIALLVQQRFFVCAFECFCDCNNRYVCDELKRLTTSDDTNKGQWMKWNSYFMYLETLHRNFDPKVWTEKISSVENKTDSIESLKGKLKDTESHVTRLETALENVRKEFEEKMADFAQKMRDVQNQAMTLVRNVNEAEKIITASQITISGIEERMRFVENQTKRLEPAIEDEKRAREQMREELLLNSSKSFSDVIKRYEKLKDLDTKLLNVDTETKLLKSVIEEERIARKNSEIRISNIETEVGFVENETKKFEQAIEASERSRQQLRVNVSAIEERTHVVENQVKQYLPIIEAEKETREQLEVNISSIEARMNFVENQTKILDLVAEEEKRDREQLEVIISTIDTKMRIAENEIKLIKSVIEAETRTREQRRHFQNVSSENSEAESQFEELKNYLDSELLRMKNEIIDLNSDIQNEKEHRTEFQEKLYQRIPKKFESVENQYKVLREDFQEELLTVKEEITTLKSDIDRERKVWTSFQEEMLLNTSKRFSEGDKQYTNLLNDFDAKLLNVIKDIKLLKSDLEEEKSARKNSSEENKETHFSVMSTLEMKDMEFQIIISEMEQRLKNVENEVENFMSAIKAEKQAREELEKKVREKHRLGSYRSRPSRALERSLSEIQKGPNTSENKATPMETVISMDQSVSNIYR